MKQHRYPGAQPFSTAQQDIFFGRDADIAHLHRLIKTEPLVLLHAKSGMGKSSLLHAGIVPAVEAEGIYKPIHIRFNAWTEGKKEQPADIARKAISPEGSKRTFLDSLIEDEPSLWHELKETQISSGGRFLLIFDQFEELFSYPQEAIAEFRDQLAEALYTKIPQRYRSVLEAQIEQGACQIKDADFDRLQEPISIRIILSVRSDRMHLMDRLSDSLPDILAHGYELQALEPIQAKAAIVEPARRDGAFSSPSFTYSEKAVQHILDFLDDAERRIETIQLQILCRTFEERAEQEGIKHFEEVDLGDLDDIISNFYTRQIALVGGSADQKRVSLLIEEGLIVPEDRQRLTLHEALILSLFQVPREHLSKLVDGGLLRAEPAQRGGYTYELSHDTLVGPALEARKLRKIQETAAAKSKQEQEVAAALAEERRKRQRSRNLAITFALFALLSILAAGWAFRQTRIAQAAELEAKNQETAAVTEKKRADNNSRIAELNAQRALNAQDTAELQRLLAENAARAARLLAGKGKRLESTISSADTYGFLMAEGRRNILEGNFRTALTNFATARFMQETPEANAAIAQVKNGMLAERYFETGNLLEAQKAYLRLGNITLDSSRYLQQRLSAIEHSQTVFRDKLKGQKLEQIETLTLEFQALSVLPAQIGELSGLKVLDLSNNSELVRLPEAIGSLKKLQKLILKDCNLLELPESLAELQALENLNLLDNAKLEILPPGLVRLTRLSELNLEACGIKNLPSGFFQLGHLQRLNLNKTPLLFLPEHFERLPELKELKLNGMVQGGKFAWLDAITRIAQLSRLEVLDLSRNRFGLQPEAILALAKIKTLHTLDLQYNALKTLPPEIAALQNLKTLNLRYNSFDENDKVKIRSWLPNCDVAF